MSILDRFSPASRRTLVRAGHLALRAQQPQLGTEALLLALTGPSDMAPVLGRQGVTDSTLRPLLADRWDWYPTDAELEMLAHLGLDLERVRARPPAGADDEPHWRLERSRRRPLRLCLASPAATLLLTPEARKVVEEALWRAGPGAAVTDVELLAGLLDDGGSRSYQALGELRVCFASLRDHLDARSLAA